jgi:predicted nucleic acid-binding protein
LVVLVIDASAFIEYLLRTKTGVGLDGIVQDPETQLHAPALCDVELAAGLRRALMTQRILATRATEALTHYLHLPVIRHEHTALLARVLALRANFSAYDAIYVALAERLGATLVTVDISLRRAAIALATVEVHGT